MAPLPPKPFNAVCSPPTPQTYNARVRINYPPHPKMSAPVLEREVKSKVLGDAQPLRVGGGAEPPLRSPGSRAPLGCPGGVKVSGPTILSPRC